MIRIVSYTFLTVLTGDLLATSGDITLSWTSPVFPKLLETDSDINPIGRPVSDNEQSWIGSLINIGAMIGPLPYGLLSQKVGRKISLLCVAIPHIISYLILAFSRTVELYYCARVLGGLALGGGYTLLPMYIAEIAEDSNRGMFSNTINIFWTFGSLIPYSVGPYVSIMYFNIILTCVPAIFFVLFFLVAPETPYYLVSKNRTIDAEESLMKLRSRDRMDVQEELQHIKEVLANDEHGTYADLFKDKTNLKALGISFVLLIAQQFSGINAILFYLQLIFASSGSEVPDDISSLIIGLVFFATSFITPQLADRLGRKPLLITSAFVMMISLIGLGAFFYLKDSTNFNTSSISWLPILSLVLFITAFNFGCAIVPWTVSSELFPVSVKPVAASLVSIVCCTSSFFVTQFYTDLSNAIGKGETYWFFAGCCLLQGIFIWVVVPETKGKSFKEIQEML